jgi:hypothetical protein
MGDAGIDHSPTLISTVPPAEELTDEHEHERSFPSE